eukprot:TRINITY_DN68292_c0_g1_i1.p1 TRINITY_DN68292_c0_g1~~TRINITY_DN68292_c0_g1_i1.p1  ORF type:complete len:754 (+),score=102.11 TRINITY_DN68292_c0_g1_i1:96-2357(+)
MAHESTTKDTREISVLHDESFASTTGRPKQSWRRGSPCLSTTSSGLSGARRTGTRSFFSQLEAQSFGSSRTPCGFAGRSHASSQNAPLVKIEHEKLSGSNLGTALHQAAAADDSATIAAIIAEMHDDTHRRSSMGNENSAMPQPYVDLDVRNVVGTTPLHLAARSGALTAVSMLLAAGASPAAATNHGETPLHESASANTEHRCLEIAWRLLDAGAPLEARNSSGDTALHFAAHNGFIGLCCLLIQRLADVADSGAGGLSALDVAVARRQHDVVFRLRGLRKLHFRLELPNALIGASGDDGASRIASSVAPDNGVHVWVRGNAPSAEVCGRMAQAVAAQLVEKLGWPLLVWHDCEVWQRDVQPSSRRRSLGHRYPRAASAVGRGDKAGEWVTPALPGDFRHERLVRLNSRGCARLDDAVSDVSDCEASGFLASVMSDWAKQPWRLLVADRYGHLEWEHNAKGWSFATLPEGTEMAKWLMRLFLRQSQFRKALPSSIRLLRHKAWRQAFEATVSALEGACAQPADDDPNLTRLLDALKVGPLGSHSDRFHYPSRDMAAQFLEERQCEFVNELGGHIGFQALRPLVLMWQGGCVGGRLSRCLEDPARVTDEEESPVHVASSPDFADGCSTRPEFLKTGQCNHDSDADGTVFLFVVASRFLCPISLTRTYCYHFQPTDPPGSQRLSHKGVGLTPGYDAHLLRRRLSIVPGSVDSFGDVTRRCAKHVDACELVAMDAAQLLPIAAIDFVNSDRRVSV